MSERYGLRDRQAALPLRAVYRLSELARAADISRWRALQLLRKDGVAIHQSGHVLVVSLAELEAKGSPFWEGIKSAEALRRRWRRSEPTAVDDFYVKSGVVP